MGGDCLELCGRPPRRQCVRLQHRHGLFGGIELQQALPLTRTGQAVATAVGSLPSGAATALAPGQLTPAMTCFQRNRLADGRTQLMEITP